MKKLIITHQNLLPKVSVFLFLLMFIHASSCVKHVNPIRELTYYATENVKAQSPRAFPGGHHELVEFIKNELRNSPDKVMLGRKVLITAQINETGKVIELKPTHNSDPALEKELKRIALMMPSWQAGIVNGKGVATDYTFEVKRN